MTIPEAIMNEHVTTKKIVHVFKNGRSRAVRIPKEFDFDGDEVEVTKNKNGDILLHPIKAPRTLAEVLASMEPIPEEEWFPEPEDYPPQPFTAFDDVN
jgi:antitoxin VapB